MSSVRKGPELGSGTPDVARPSMGTHGPPFRSRQGPSSDCLPPCQALPLSVMAMSELHRFLEHTASQLAHMLLLLLGTGFSAAVSSGHSYRSQRLMSPPSGSPPLITFSQICVRCPCAAFLLPSLHLLCSSCPFTCLSPSPRGLGPCFLSPSPRDSLPPAPLLDTARVSWTNLLSE